VVTQRPVFGLHEIYPKMMGAEVELLELNEELGFDLGAWCAAVAKAPKIAFLPNPSNPVGCMMDAAQFAQVLEATPANTVLVVDEAYYEYALHDDDYPDVLAMLERGSGPGSCCAPSPRPGAWPVCAWATAWPTAPSWWA
jgi:histidinol-phosphate aminotransferase